MITTAALLAGQGFFAGMRPVHLERLSYYAHRSVFRAGQRVFDEGGRADRFWVIREGLVQIDSHLPGRPDITIDTLGPGSVLGWSWLFPPHTWHYGALAVEPTLTVELDGPGVARLCEGDPEIGYEVTRRFLPVLVERLQATRGRLVDEYAGG